ncbi:ParB N-terminal domain-containing protein [Erythrobacter aurantius]
MKPYTGNAKRHPEKQIREIADSIARNGFTNPVLIDADGVIIAGHGRYAAALQLGLSEIPCIRLIRLTPAQVRAYRFADNKLAEKAVWDEEILRIEIEALQIEGVELEDTGFDTVEIDILFENQKGEPSDPAEDAQPDDGPAVTVAGDLWILGDHRLICADATDPSSFKILMDGEKARMAITDPPYNVPIQGHVSGLGEVQHREFAKASGEMSAEQFTEFLGKVFKLMAAHSLDGSIHYAFMD